MGFTGKICNKGVWDESISDIKFDNNGNSSYSKIFEKMLEDFPRGEVGLKKWEDFVEKIKINGKNKKYDCLIGVSGGTDSSYLIHIAKKYGLRPLAVYIDNGWGSDVVVKNIRKLITPHKIDLITHVIDYEEVKNVLTAYLKAGFSWVDSPTDLAIKTVLFRVANKEGIKHILNGHDFRSEGFQPNDWTYSDAKQLNYIVKKFNNKKIKKYPAIGLIEFGYYTVLKNIQFVKPFFYLEYDKESAKKMLKEQYQWEDYGGHHYENIFTKFIISYWMVEKFNIDKRKITFSGQILSGFLNREEAINTINSKPFNPDTIRNDIDYICKKLDFTLDDFNKCFSAKNTYFYDFPSYFPYFDRFKKIVFPLIKFALPNKPLMFYQIDNKDE